jgi:hypothetical protein
VASKASRILGVHKINSPGFQVISDTPRALGIYRMDSLKLRVTYDTPRAQRTADIRDKAEATRTEHTDSMC